MGPEQQQEFKSEKPLIKQQRKTIPFTDNSIENWKPKKPRERRSFPKSTTTNGLKIVSRKIPKDKYWELTYHLNRKPLLLSLGPFIPEVRGTEYITKEMLVLIGKHKDMRRTHWLTDPKNTYKERDEAILKEAKREVLEDLMDMEWDNAEKNGGMTFMGETIKGVTKAITSIQNTVLYGIKRNKE